MLKKIIVALLLINTFLFSGDINLRSVKGDYHKGNITFIISANDENAKGFPRIHTKDWVALYKKEDSNSWGNVLTWGWTKDFGSEKDGDAILQKNINLQDGEYEVRYFKDNSYTTYKSSSFVVGESQLNLKRITGVYSNEDKAITFYAGLANIYKNFNPSPKDWVGLYKKGDSNAWKNILTWGWLEDFHQEHFGFTELTKNIDLQNGEYEVRYFKDNSFTTYMSSSFEIGKSDINLDVIRATYSNENISITLSSFKNKKIKANPKDWVGIYHKVTSNAWVNVLAWTWVEDIKNPVPTDDGTEARYTILQNIPLQNGEYVVRYFLNNSFTTHKSSSFKVE
jgi:hypothetical protein